MLFISNDDVLGKENGIDIIAGINDVGITIFIAVFLLLLLWLLLSFLVMVVITFVVIVVVVFIPIIVMN